MLGMDGYSNSDNWNNRKSGHIVSVPTAAYMHNMHLSWYIISHDMRMVLFPFILIKSIGSVKTTSIQNENTEVLCRH